MPIHYKTPSRYAPLKTSDPQGGRPDHFSVETLTFDQKLMVFLGMHRDGTFGLFVFRNENLNGPGYHRRFWGTLDSEWVSFEWLDEAGSKF